jgi:hypothetical protein
MSITERATVAVCGVLLASVFGVALAWMIFLAIGTDEGKTSAEQIKIIRVVPVRTDTEDRFMLIDRDEGRM